MHYPSCRNLPLGLVAMAFAGALGCNSHLLLPSGDPEVIIIDPPPAPPPVEPPLTDAGVGGIGSDGPSIGQLPDGAVPDLPPGVEPGVEPGPEPGPEPQVEPSRDAGVPDTVRIVPDTGCPTPVPPLNFPENPTCQGTEGGYGEAFQKALWFLHVNRSGPGVANTYVQWRGDAHLDDAHIKLDPNSPNGVDMSQAFITRNKAILDPKNTGEVDLSGGFHDAGDYIKFGLTTGFTGSMLGWSLYEFPQSYRDAGLEGSALDLLRWADDYFMRCAFLDGSGNLVAFAQQVSDGTDHSCFWMPPEVRRIDFCPRKGYFVTSEKPAADTTSAAAAALAVSALVLKDKDPAYADKCLKYAKALYAFAAKVPTIVGAVTDGLYTSEYAYDDLAWAAVWLYLATGTQSYLDDILGPSAQGGGWLDGYPGFKTTCLRSATASCWAESATHDWNSVRTGVFLKMAQILRDQNHDMAKAMQSIAREDSMKWNDGTVLTTPGGFAVLSEYGSARYNSAGQFVALLYAKLFGDDATAASAIRPWAKRQTDYILGKNPLNKSYMMGYTDNYCTQPHHAAGHASIWGMLDNPRENRHIIWGALVNGPGSADDHTDDRWDFGSNEVTIDYNVSLIAALSAIYDLYGKGQCPLSKFPPLEPDWDEFYTFSGTTDAGKCRSQVTVTMINETVHVPRYDKHLSVRYFFDIKELKGGSINDVTASLPYDRGAGEWNEPTKLIGPKQCPKSPTTYYYEMSYEGYMFWGRIPRIGSPRTFMLDIGVSNSNPNCLWDPSNDWSYQGLKAMPSGDTDPPRTPHITVYSSGLRAFGEEPPDCFEAPTPLKCPPKN